MTAPAAALLALADEAVDLVVPRLVAAKAARVSTKSSSTDLVTEFDEWAEATLTAHLSQHRPDDGFLAEEGHSRASRSGVTWVIDPIDGTTNFVYDLPGWSVSIAARVDGVDVAGIVHDGVRGERFRALRGGGATLDGEPITVSARSELSTALVATGFSYDRARRRAQAEVLVEVLPAVRDIRRFGGAALDLCAVACGRVDAYYERGLSPWDVAAGGLIAREAGATVREPRDGACLAATPAIAEAFADLVAGAGGHTA